MKFNEDYLKRFEEAFGDASSKLNSMKLKKWLKDNEDIKSYLEGCLEHEPRLHNFIDTVWAFRNRFVIDEYRCKTCGKLMALERPAFYLKSHCSTKCAKLDPETTAKLRRTVAEDPSFYERRQAKTRKTCLEKYGSEAPSQNEEVKQKMRAHWIEDSSFWERRNEKSKKTCLAKFGTANPSSSEEVKHKKAETCLKNFGVTSPAKAREVQEKTKKTNLEKYGVGCQFQRKEVISKANDISWRRVLSWSEYIAPAFPREQWKGFNRRIEYQWICQKCHKVFTQKLYTSKHCSLDDNMPRCLSCYPRASNSSLEELEVLSYMKELWPSAAKDKELIKPKELDIAVPEIKMAVEFNGDYWHSVKAAKKTCHADKLKLCEAKGWKLVTLFEHFWITKRDLVKKKLAELAKPREEDIETFVAEVEDAGLASSFYETNSFYDNLSREDNLLEIGAFTLDGNLVELMTFKVDAKRAFLLRHARAVCARGASAKIISLLKEKLPDLSAVEAEEDLLWPIDKMFSEIGFKYIGDLAPKLMPNGSYSCGSRRLELSFLDK